MSKNSVIQRLRNGLAKTRNGLFPGIAEMFTGGHKADQAQLDDLENRLLMADVGIDATRVIIDRLNQAIKQSNVADPCTLIDFLQHSMAALLKPAQQAFNIPENRPKPFVILLVGVNGSGKTTTIGKLSHYFLNNGKSVLLAAGDTFRAAAIEQIQSWAARNSVPVVAQHSGADSAAVIYDALQSARSQNTDIVIADTAGRLHNNTNLMDELKKIHKTIGKFDRDLAIEVILVIDAGTGQNAIAQAKQFHEAIGLNSIILTKLDGTAKGGIVFALTQSLNLPLRFIGVGEQIDDLRPFDADRFTEALLSGP